MNHKAVLLSLGLTVVACCGYKWVRALKAKKEFATALNKDTETILTYPKNINNACEIGRYIRNGGMCVVNLSDVPPFEAQRIADYLCGNCDAFDGTITRINKTTFTVSASKHFTPQNLHTTR